LSSAHPFSSSFHAFLRLAPRVWQRLHYHRSSRRACHRSTTSLQPTTNTTLQSQRRHQSSQKSRLTRVLYARQSSRPGLHCPGVPRKPWPHRIDRYWKRFMRHGMRRCLSAHSHQYPFRWTTTSLHRQQLLRRFDDGAPSCLKTQESCSCCVRCWTCGSVGGSGRGVGLSTFLLQCSTRRRLMIVDGCLLCVLVEVARTTHRVGTFLCVPCMETCNISTTAL